MSRPVIRGVMGAEVVHGAWTSGLAARSVERSQAVSGRAAGSLDRPAREPLPFHPLDLGEEALRALFGFVVEGRRMPGDIDADHVPVHRIRLTDPDGPTPEQRQAVRDALMARMKPPRIFRMENGRLVETDLP
ncbi:DUF6928 family protein [Uniformispora flossi]|uniref:DUF6928 family protein n=1 Tax=Uniformispora flossi TaxID=3390723 RepID=UPI003C2E3BF9